MENEINAIKTPSRFSKINHVKTNSDAKRNWNYRKTKKKKKSKKGRVLLIQFLNFLLFLRMVTTDIFG